MDTNAWSLTIFHSRLSDAGFYECQVAGAITIYKIIKLDVVGKKHICLDGI